MQVFSEIDHTNENIHSQSALVTQHIQGQPVLQKTLLQKNENRQRTDLRTDKYGPKDQ